MLSAIRDIGELVSNKPITSERQIEGKVLSVLINPQEPSSIEIGIEDFSNEKKDVYLFKAGSSRGNLPAPFAPITDPVKSYKKVKKWVQDCLKVSGVVEENIS